MSYKVLVVDLVGLKFNDKGEPDASEVADFIEQQGAKFHYCSAKEWLMSGKDSKQSVTKDIHFFYQPHLSSRQAVLAACKESQYDGVIAAATPIPTNTQFNLAGVRIGAGTGNMASRSWGGADGVGGDAILMNTPSFNARATAHMVFKALLAVKPSLPLAKIQQQVIDKTFDTGRDLVNFATLGLEGQTMAVLGYGHIGREVAKLANSFGMKVRVFARSRHQAWIESQGYAFASTIEQAVTGADMLTLHLGLGVFDNDNQCFSHENLIDSAKLCLLNSNAVVINFDRGELIDVKALKKAMKKGTVAHVAVDADIFVDESGEVNGPLQPYLALHEAFAGRVQLLPHIAADTEHNSRVAGAKQAVKQMLAVIRDKKGINVIGDVPAGYEAIGAETVAGVGVVTNRQFHQLSQTQLDRLAHVTADLAEFWREMSEVSANAHTESTECLLRDEILAADAQDVVKHSNELLAMLSKSGLLGPYRASD